MTKSHQKACFSQFDSNYILTRKTDVVDLHVDGICPTVHQVRISHVYSTMIASITVGRQLCELYAVPTITGLFVRCAHLCGTISAD